MPPVRLDQLDPAERIGWDGLTQLGPATPVVTVDTVADLADLTVLDGSVVRTRGCLSVADAAGADYLYHTTGRSGVTITAYGTNIAFGGGDDYFQLLDNVVRIVPAAVNGDVTALQDWADSQVIPPDFRSLELRSGLYLLGEDETFTIPNISGGHIICHGGIARAAGELEYSTPGSRAGNCVRIGRDGGSNAIVRFNSANTVITGNLNVQGALRDLRADLVSLTSEDKAEIGFLVDGTAYPPGGGQPAGLNTGKLLPTSLAAISCQIGLQLGTEEVQNAADNLVIPRWQSEFCDIGIKFLNTQCINNEFGYCRFYEDSIGVWIENGGNSTFGRVDLSQQNGTLFYASGGSSTQFGIDVQTINIDAASTNQKVLEVAGESGTGGFMTIGQLFNQAWDQSGHNMFVLRGFWSVEILSARFISVDAFQLHDSSHAHIVSGVLKPGVTDPTDMVDTVNSTGGTLSWGPLKVWDSNTVIPAGKCDHTGTLLPSSADTSTTVDTVADLAGLSLSDGDVVKTLGATTVGDGGRQTLQYHATGRSGITHDIFGFYIVPSGASGDWYFEDVDKLRASLPVFGGVRKTDDPEADNTPAFERLIQAKAHGKPVPGFVPAGVWPVKTPDLFGAWSAAEHAATRTLSLFGVKSEYEGQDSEQNRNTPSSVIELDFPSDSDFWLERYSTEGNSNYQFGNWEFRNLRIEVPTGQRGSFLKLGPSSDIEARSAFRGLTIRDCKFGYFDHPYGANRPWLRDTTGAENVGWIHDPTRTCTAIELINAYDVKIEHNTFRGWTWSIRANEADSPVIGGNHYIITMRGPTLYGDGVPGTIGPHEYCEDVMVTGHCLDTGDLLTPRVETGYRNIGTPQERDAPVGAYPLHTGMTWSIAQRSDQLVLANFPPGYDATHYLLDWSVIKLTPSDSSIEPYHAIIKDVTATGATIHQAYTVETDPGVYQYGPMAHPRAVSGSATQLLRCYGVSTVISGLSTIHGGSIGRNEQVADVPLAVVCPDRRPIPIIGLTFAASLDQEGVVLARVHYGSQFLVHGGVVQTGGNFKIDHPCAATPERYPEYNANQRSWLPEFKAPNGKRYDFGILPGYGIKVGNNHARELTLRRATAADAADLEFPTRLPWVIKPADITFTAYWQPAIEETGCRLDIRVWSNGAHTAANGLHVYDGSPGGSNQYALVDGWQTITHDADPLATTLAIYNSTTGGGALEIAWIGVTLPRHARLSTATPAIDVNLAGAHLDAGTTPVAATLAAGHDAGQLMTIVMVANETSLREATYRWVLSLADGSVSEYYLELSGGGDPGLPAPHSVLQSNVAMASGTLGALAAGQYAYGDNDSLGFSTLYVRLSDSTDPDLKAARYIEGVYDSTVTVANHIDGNDTVFPFDAINEHLVLLWTGLKWLTIVDGSS